MLVDKRVDCFTTSICLLFKVISLAISMVVMKVDLSNNVNSKKSSDFFYSLIYSEKKYEAIFLVRYLKVDSSR